MKKKYSLNEIKIEPAVLDMAQPLGRFLITLFRQFENELTHELKKLGYTISTSDFNAIRNIEPGGSNPVRIAELAGITKQAMSKQLAKLEKSGLIKKIEDEKDQRAKLIVFTKKGEQFLHHAIAIIAKIEKRFAEKLGSEKQLLLLKTNLQNLIE